MSSQQLCFFSLALTLAVGSVWASAGIKEQLDAVLSINADADYGEYLAGECQTCHVSTTAAGKRDPNIPVIHGKAPVYLIRGLLEYRAEIRDNQTMRSIAGALSDEEIAAVTAWFSQQE